VNALIQPNPDAVTSSREVAAIGPQALELDGQPRDLELELVDRAPFIDSITARTR
jgi:hypothetical protein